MTELGLNELHCPCGGIMVIKTFKGLDDPVQKGAGVLGMVAGTCIGARITYQCLNCARTRVEWEYLGPI